MGSTSLNISYLLRGVSRSFGLSIRLLPAGLRGPVGLAYLLARTSDTVADTAQQPASERLVLLQLLEQHIGQASDMATLTRALGEFAPHVKDRHEQALLLRTPACLDALEMQAPADQAVIRQVLAAIIEGQRWDLLTLDQGPGLVQSNDEVDRYTWQVAGSVGEFWTRLCALHLRNWHTGSEAEMLQWGAHYGKGLQRLNILRDAGRDLHAGRCYWPAEQLQTLGLDRDSLCAAVRSGDRAVLQRMAPALDAWHHLTESLLHDGLCYSLALRGRRLRLASALPCLIGIRTLRLLRQAGTQALLQHIKLPRQEVRQLLWTLMLGGVSDRQLRACWRQALGGAGPSAPSARIEP